VSHLDPVLLVLILGACGTCLLGGVAVGLFLAGVLDFTHRDEDDLAAHDRKGVRW
jgi:hypothetical protein